MHDIQLTFTHQNVDFPGCDAAVGGDCTKYGIPGVENDVMDFHLSMDLDVAVTPVYVTYGVHGPGRRERRGADRPGRLPRREQRADRARSAARRSTHYFAGTPTNPVLIGVAPEPRLGGRPRRRRRPRQGQPAPERETPTSPCCSTLRFPTGGTADLLGSGKFAGRVLGIVDSHFGNFSPHINVGYLYHAGEQQNDAVLGTVGFDQAHGRAT